MRKYGVPYCGSKSKLAEEILKQLPDGKRFVDLFGGGFAMSECALLSGKFEKVLYNEINMPIFNLIQDLTTGKLKEKDLYKWISRDEFFEKVEECGLIKICWSFGNNGKNYLYGKKLEEIKRLAHLHCVEGIALDGFEVMGDTIQERRINLCREAKRRFKELIESIPGLKEEYKEYKKILNNKSDVRHLVVIFTRWLKSTGITAKEINQLTGSQMSSHYLCQNENGQPAIPTAEMWEKIKQSAKIKDVPDEVLALLDDDKRFAKLEHLERLQHLEHLQHLERLECLELINGDYREFEYKDGDVVYCDPPYEGTGVDYQSLFTHQEFYDWVATRPYPVWFSSYEISDDRFQVVWEKERTSSYGTGNKCKSVERLYWNGK